LDCANIVITLRFYWIVQRLL